MAYSHRYLEITDSVFHFYLKETEEHQKKIQEGVDLFAKHFGSFWI
jgi:hypothetical protein